MPEATLSAKVHLVKEPRRSSLGGQIKKKSHITMTNFKVKAYTNAAMQFKPKGAVNQYPIYTIDSECF